MQEIIPQAFCKDISNPCQVIGKIRHLYLMVSTKSADFSPGPLQCMWLTAELKYSESKEGTHFGEKGEKKREDESDSDK